MPCFSFYFYVFFLHKIGEQEGRTGSALWGRRGVGGEGVRE
jgi:hypothetical protein